jgi:uncharacterized CHY-type Zn-finger protein
MTTDDFNLNEMTKTISIYDETINMETITCPVCNVTAIIKPNSNVFECFNCSSRFTRD